MLPACKNWRRRLVGNLANACHHQDGQRVKTGDALYRIEKGPFEASVQQAKANVLRAQAQLDNATIQRQRAVVGIGVNLSGTLPRELAAAAITLEQAAGAPVERAVFIEQLLAQVERWIDRYVASGLAAIAPACFNCVIPLSFIPEASELGALPGPTGLTDLKTLAIARLMLDNIAHIKAFWIMQSISLSQLSLDWGVDDLDGTVVWYDITKRQGDGVHQELHVEDIKRIIREAGRETVERDTLYRERLRDPEPALAGRE
jgi:hypothetical protein